MTRWQVDKGKEALSLLMRAFAQKRRKTEIILIIVIFVRNSCETCAISGEKFRQLKLQFYSREWDLKHEWHRNLT